MKILLYTTTLIAVASAWSCPSLSVVDPFDVSEFSGVWYNQYSRNTPLEIGSCLVSNYTYDSDTGVISIESSLKSIFGTAETMSGIAVLADASSSEGRLNLTYKTPIKDFDYDLLVLSTDYENYAVLYSCMEILFYPYESSWILTREQVITEATMRIIEAAMKTVAEDGGPSFSQMKQNDQTDC